uniref:DegT/DnrJ/EryC1/StrS family aminotransferase n=1 Tax=candidate division CPR3 bacterium TaxID=2268181 RepID=A0A7V3J982_UNCC3
MSKKSQIPNLKSKIPAILGGEPAFDKPVPITEPTIPPIHQLKSMYEKVLKSRMITNSKFVQEFEARVAEHLGVKHAIAVNSCTSGLMLIMKALDLKGEVILPSFTFHATAHAVVWNGLKPVFVDCDPETYNIDPKEVEKAITPRTCAILGVHIFGNPADVEALEKIAKKHKLKLIFDAAHGFGSKYKGKHVGGFGDAESFSLSPTKLLTAGEGGIVTTNDDEIARRVRIGRNYGDPGTYDCEFSGFSARMSEFQAILGIESLKMLESNVLRRNKMANLYKTLLAKIPGISFQKIKAGNRSSYKDFSILIDERKFGISRDKLYEALMAENIVVKKYFYPPVHKQRAFEKYASQHDANLHITERISTGSISLPLFSHISEMVVEKICSVVVLIYKRWR